MIENSGGNSYHVQSLDWETRDVMRRWWWRWGWGWDEDDDDNDDEDEMRMTMMIIASLIFRCIRIATDCLNSFAWVASLGISLFILHQLRYFRFHLHIFVSVVCIILYLGLGSLEPFCNTDNSLLAWQSKFFSQNNFTWVSLFLILSYACSFSNSIIIGRFCLTFVPSSSELEIVWSCRIMHYDNSR